MTLEADVADYVIKRIETDHAYRELKDLEADIILQIKEQFPHEFDRWQRGIAPLRIHGVELRVKRTYDVDKVKALLGEERPDLFSTETITREKVDGRRLAQLWKDLGMADKLADTIIPPAPKLEIVK